MSTYTVQGPMIEGLDVVPPNYAEEEEENIPPPQPVPQPVQVYQQLPAPTVTQPGSQPPVQAADFIDPAILSFTRAAAPVAPAAAPPPPPSAAHAPVPISSQKAPIPPSYAAPTKAPRPRGDGPTTALRSHQSVPVLRQAPKTNTAQHLIPAPPRYHTPTSTTTMTKRYPVAKGHAFQGLCISKDTAADSSAFDETDDALSALPANQPAYSGKRSRRGGKGRRQEQAQEFPGAVVPRSIPAITSGLANTKGTLGKVHKKNSRAHAYNNGDEEGWATEDINDIRDTEFDFQGNLDRFDKKTVFSQIRVCCDPDYRRMCNYANDNTIGRRYDC